MAQKVEEHPLAAACEALLAHGLDGTGETPRILEALRILVNEVSKIERAEYLGAQPYERNAARRDHANGFKPRTVRARVGEVTFDVPQVRGGGFYPSALERGSRTQQALNLALAEMYVQGVSTRRVIDVPQRLLGPEIAISSTQVSRIAATLDEGLAVWRERPLGAAPRTRCSTPATSACARVGGSSIAQCWWRWVSTPAASGACWGCRWRCRRPRCIGATSPTAWSSVACTACG